MTDTADGSAAGSRTNRLAGESSPYLRQHATNPVDWYPWGEEAFAAARSRDVPILLSVGYSACHWCHVMAHESFEDPTTAAFMNTHYVNVKVDREERPDVDAVYMTATQAMTGHGGWPMTVFMTADGHPFFCGTYFPPAKRGWGGELTGFPRLLDSIRRAWEEDRDSLLASADNITEQLIGVTTNRPYDAVTVSAADADAAVAHFRKSYDPVHGGFGGAPKFPSPSNLDFLLMHDARTGGGTDAPSAREMTLGTLAAMARGGIYDHLGGGFHRYSVDAEWVVPHFEKMLYDNAQLAQTYLHAWQISGDAAFERTARETLDYLLREMTDPAGGWYAAQDADTEGIEGKFFVWTPEEIREALASHNPDDIALWFEVYDVTEAGNFSDPHHPEFGSRTVLRQPTPVTAATAHRSESPEAITERLDRMRATLLAARAGRVTPDLDDKVLTSWNGLALAAFAEAGRVLGDARYLDAARRNAAFVRETMWRDGELRHSYHATDGEAKVRGLLEDYAYYGLGLVELYRATGDPEHLHWAAELWEVLLARFRDPDGGGFFDTPTGGEALLLRQRPLFDAATPSGNGAAAQLGIWLARTLDRAEWEQTAIEVFALAGDHLNSAATGFGALWQAAELTIAPPREIAIVGPPAARAPLEAAVARRFLPATVLAPAAGEALPLHAGRLPAGGGAAAYVCEAMTCDLPATDAETLGQQIDALNASTPDPSGLT